MPERITDTELRQRLEDHRYNVPPITDTTRNVLLKKLRQLDQQVNTTRFDGIDYSSAEEDYDIPISSTKISFHSSKMERNRNSFEKTIPLNKNGSGLSNLMSQSDDEDDSDEIDEESEEKSDDNEEMSISNEQSTLSKPESKARLRSKTVTPNINQSSSTQPYTLKSHHLRKNIDKFGSLNEALSSIPSIKSIQTYQSKNFVTKLNPTTSQATRTSNSYPSRSNVGSHGSSMMISSLIMLFAMLFFGFIGYQYFNLGKIQKLKQKIPICTEALGEKPNLDCIPGHQIQYTTQLLEKLLNFVKETPKCRSSDTRYSYSAVMKMLHSDSEVHLKNILVLLKENPQWGVIPVFEDNETSIIVGESNKSMTCMLQYYFSAAFNIMIQTAGYLIVLSVFAAVACFIVLRFKKMSEKKELETQEIYTLIEKSLALLQENQKIKCGISPSYLAIDHVRDQLIPPKERVQKAHVWRKVIKYIQENESRVREEIQQVHGEEFKVWQWLPDLPPSSTSYRGPMKSDSTTYSRKATTQPNAEPLDFASGSCSAPGWQGSAFNLNKHVLAPSEPPTACLKIRYMFNLNRTQPDWIKVLKKDIIVRCEGARILHIAVDKESPEGIVYIKTLSTSDAGKVFNCMHGQWYKGKLLTAKYLRSDRYEQRFPDSNGAETPLTPELNG